MLLPVPVLALAEGRVLVLFIPLTNLELLRMRSQVQATRPSACVVARVRRYTPPVRTKVSTTNYRFETPLH